MGCGSSIPGEPCVFCQHAEGKVKRALHYCLHCGLALCVACSQQHQDEVLQTKFQRVHRVVPLTEYKRGLHNEYLDEIKNRGCRDHVTELKKTYCLEHKVATCRDCNTESHATCTVKNLEELRNAWTKEIDRKMRKLKFAYEKLDQRHAQIEGCLNKLPQQRTNLKDELHDQLDSLKDLIETTKESRIQKIDEVLDNQKVHLEELLGQVKEQRAEIEQLYKQHSSNLKHRDMRTLQEERKLFKQLPAMPPLPQDTIYRALADVTLHQPLLNEESMDYIIGSVEVATPKTADISVLVVQAYPPTTAGSVATTIGTIKAPYTAVSRRNTQAALVDVDE